MDRSDATVKMLDEEARLLVKVLGIAKSRRAAVVAMTIDDTIGLHSSLRVSDELSAKDIQVMHIALRDIVRKIEAKADTLGIVLAK